MRTPRFLFALVLLATAYSLQPTAFCQVPVRWIAEASRPVAQQVECWQGETLLIEPLITEYGVTREFGTNAVVLLYLQTNGMGSAWWPPVTGSTGGVPGRLSATFHPTNDVGASEYTFFVCASEPGGRSYRARGTLLMRAAPGFTPAEAPAPSYYPALAAELVPLLLPLIESGGVSGPAATNIANGLIAASNAPLAAAAAAAQQQADLAYARATGPATLIQSITDPAVYISWHGCTGIVYEVSETNWYVTASDDFVAPDGTHWPFFRSFPYPLQDFSYTEWQCYPDLGGIYLRAPDPHNLDWVWHAYPDTLPARLDPLYGGGAGYAYVSHTNIIGRVFATSAPADAKVSSVSGVASNLTLTGTATYNGEPLSSLSAASVSNTVTTLAPTNNPAFSGTVRVNGSPLTSAAPCACGTNRLWYPLGAKQISANTNSTVSWDMPINSGPITFRVRCKDAAGGTNFFCAVQYFEAGITPFTNNVYMERTRLVDVTCRSPTNSSVPYVNYTQALFLIGRAGNPPVDTGAHTFTAWWSPATTNEAAGL